MTTPTQTPTPWALQWKSKDRLWIIDANGKPIFAFYKPGPERRKIAEFIVFCVNRHKALVNALSSLIDFVNDLEAHWPSAETDPMTSEILGGLMASAVLVRAAQAEGKDI